MDRMRLSAPSNYYWNISFAYERFKKDPLDYIIFLLFVGHVVGFFGFLIYLKVQTSRKKLFMYHN
ncbi:hypothetical protein MACK_003249 [Theileria orientalis]|uniref:Uncharacterized protein n=1 Tax=Theileria orientalis TaxID=68886 RepID=A0A976SID2_THEOR|nr:hypothetical protein MACK_003249 [Theileria orientalis]